MAEIISCLRSCVMEAVIETESSNIPKNVREVVGPSVFSVLMGTLMVEHTWLMAAMLSLQMFELGGPAVKKSSR